MDDNLNIGIVGCGVIGDVLVKWLTCNTTHNVHIYDPNKGYLDSMVGVDIIFINVHSKPNDFAKLLNIIRELPNVPIFIRTTIELGMVNLLKSATNMDINYMPEFLTERTAYDDFNNQTMIYTNHIELLNKVFDYKDYIEMSNDEAIMAKYVHNVFGALKVTYFNGIFDMCDNMGIDFNKVTEGALLSGYINKEHTKVPHNGTYGYDGKCFPKDVTSFKSQTSNHEIHNLIDIIDWMNLVFTNRKGEL